jgi:hypothetical protein
MRVGIVVPREYRDDTGRLIDRCATEFPFLWAEGKLEAVLPPGRTRTVPDLPPGTYAFTVASEGVRPRQEGSGGGLAEKGQIVVVSTRGR